MYFRMAQLLSKFRIECQDMKIIADIGKLPTEKRYTVLLILLYYIEGIL